MKHFFVVALVEAALLLCAFASLQAPEDTTDTHYSEEFATNQYAESVEAVEENLEELNELKVQPKKKASSNSNFCGTGLIGDCPVAAKLKCGKLKCCPKILFGVDTDDAGTLNGAAAMHTSKVHFVVRYISQQATAPMAPSEVASWHANKFKVVAVWEVSRLRPVEGGSTAANFANGVADARLAVARMRQYGAATRPVYFAVDAFVQPTKALWGRLPPSLRIAKVNDLIPYFKGIRSVMNPSRVGAYGSYTTIKGLFNRKLIKWGWQASSFDSAHRLDPRAHLYQCSTKPPNVFGSTQLDYDFALRSDYGQF